MVLRSSRVGISRLRMLAGAGCAALMIAASPVGATAQSAVTSFNIRSAPLSQSLLEFGRQAGISVAVDQSLTSGLRGRAVSGDLPVGEALDRLLVGTGLTAEFAGPNAVRLVRGGQGDAGGNDLLQGPIAQETTSVADVIVTAQKREESIQSVPIAVSAFSAENLDAMKIEGGSELMRAIPNVTFSKGNFSMYNFAIRGIGTKAISASSDPAVAVSFNNTPLIRNRLFEQEYMDVNRVEVLRGPQGTLYGRNATGGVVNMIPNLPQPDFDAMLKAEVGNYSSMRGQMMVNIPLTDTFWVRAAGNLTKREGFDHNTHKDTRVNGRDLHSLRLAAAWEPSDRFRANFIWENFEEDDNRSRTGKQLCTRDPGPERVGNVAITDVNIRGRLSQGCLAKSLYDDAAYDTPNSLALQQVYMLSGVSIGYIPESGLFGNISVPLLNRGKDLYDGVLQSRSLREISTEYDPVFRAKNNLFQLNLEFDLNEKVSLFSQTTYAKDDFYSTQDYNRFVSVPVFNNSDEANGTYFPLWLGGVIHKETFATPGGVYNDPQLGKSSRALSADLNVSDNNQLFQEFRLAVNLNEKLNFHLGANYTKFRTEDNYYVFSNLFSAMAEFFYNSYGTPLDLIPKQTNYCEDGSKSECVYVDYSPLSELAGDGHNYFRSKNVANTESWGIFGEAYIKLNSAFNLTLGARYTEDEKVFTPYSTQLLLGYWDLYGAGQTTGGRVARGYPASPDIIQNWGAWTGRAVLDWSPVESWMYYASISRGYKGGGANPPRADIDPKVIQYQPLAETFEPEYVNAIEFGAKGRMFNNSTLLNATAFYYDYKDYQVSQIVDRTSLNENFDATSMGVELEIVSNPFGQFKVNGNLGYLKTKIQEGSSVDVMNRTQGNSDWMVVRPTIQVPSNCIAPTRHVETILASRYDVNSKMLALGALCGGAERIGSFDPNFKGAVNFSSMYGFEYQPLTEAPNGGRGFDADLKGNELPNAPKLTANIGFQNTWIVGRWDLTLRADYYYQSSSYFRVYNTDYDKVDSWDNVGLSVHFDNIVSGTSVQAYVKNVFDKSTMVDAFTNSDDSLLTTNVFTLEPRIYGFSVKKIF